MPADILGAVKRGIDMFDCVLPTRSGRTGKVFTKYGQLNIRNARYKNDFRPLDIECKCSVCVNNVSRSYLHHLSNIGDMLASIYLTLHNISHYIELMSEIRNSIINKNFDEVLIFLTKESSKFLLSILMIVAFFFSALSISEIFEDYVHDKKIKNISIKLLYSSAIIIPFLTIIAIFNLNI